MRPLLPGGDLRPVRPLSLVCSGCGAGMGICRIPYKQTHRKGSLTATSGKKKTGRWC